MNIDIRYKPSLKQWYVHQAIEQGKRYILLLGGIQGGKSHCGVAETCIRAINYKAKPGSIDKGVSWLVSPTYPMSLATENHFLNFMPKGLIRNKITRDRGWELFNGHKIYIKTADDPEYLRGPSLHTIQLDEGAIMKKMVWDICLGRVLATKGIILVTTTPKGKNWVYDELYLPYKRDKDEDYYAIKMKSEENPILSKKDVDKLRKKYTGKFAAQELDADFVQFEGLVFDAFDEETHICPPFSIPKNWHIWSAIDFGYNDPFCVLWFAKHPDKKRIYVIDEHYAERVLLKDHANIMRNAHPNCITNYKDPSAGQQAFELSSYLGSKYQLLNALNDIVPGIHVVNSKFANKLSDGLPELVIFSNCINLRKELGLYSYPSAESKNKGEKPIDAHNHACDCLRYGIFSRYKYYPEIEEEVLSEDERIAEILAEGGRLTMNERIRVHRSRNFKKINTITDETLGDDW